MKPNFPLVGRHYETGTVTNALSGLGFRAPHTGKPYSEALLFGLSGGIAFGYFTFAYKGHLPHLALLTRNTFSPLDTLFERLGGVQDLRQSTKAEIAEKNLKEALDDHGVVIVWADIWSLPHLGLPQNTGMWANFPMLAIGYDENHVFIVGESQTPSAVPHEIFTAARAKVKQDRFKQITLGAPNEQSLANAVSDGIQHSLTMMLENPPAGAKQNWGLDGMNTLIDLLTNLRNKAGWERYFPIGPEMWQALAGNPGQPGMYEWIQTWGTNPGADRGTFADFLEEAALLLNKPSLKDVAGSYRETEALWIKLADVSLPNRIPEFARAKTLVQDLKRSRWENGDAELELRHQWRAERKALGERMKTEFPLDASEASLLRGEIRHALEQVAEAETKAIHALRQYASSATSH